MHRVTPATLKRVAEKHGYGVVTVNDWFEFDGMVCTQVRGTDKVFEVRGVGHDKNESRREALGKILDLVNERVSIPMLRSAAKKTGFRDVGIVEHFGHGACICQVNMTAENKMSGMNIFGSGYTVQGARREALKNLQKTAKTLDNLRARQPTLQSRLIELGFSKKMWDRIEEKSAQLDLKPRQLIENAVDLWMQLDDEEEKNARQEAARVRKLRA